MRTFFLMLGVSLSFSTLAHDFSYTYEGKTLNYNILDSEAKTCEVTQSEANGNIIIPEVAKFGFQEYRVTSIHEEAFESCISLESVEIPNSVTLIGDNAFNYCRSLSMVEIPNSVTLIGRGAFAYCNSLESVKTPNSVTMIDDDTFYNCNSLTSVVIPSSIEFINEEAFSYCTSLESVEIPNSVTWIGDRAFRGCDSLISIKIPSNINHIGFVAFAGCVNLTSVYYGADEPIEGHSSIFDDSTYYNAVIYMSKAGIEKAHSIDPWKNFINIVEYNFGSGIGQGLHVLDNCQHCEIYTLSGILIDDPFETLSPGIYIVYQGNSVKKIIVKSSQCRRDR